MQTKVILCANNYSMQEHQNLNRSVVGWRRRSRLQIYSHKDPMKRPEINNMLRVGLYCVYTVDVYELRSYSCQVSRGVADVMT